MRSRRRCRDRAANSQAQQCSRADRSAFDLTRSFRPSSPLALGCVPDLVKRKRIPVSHSDVRIPDATIFIELNQSARPAWDAQRFGDELSSSMTLVNIAPFDDRALPPKSHGRSRPGSALEHAIGNATPMRCVSVCPLGAVGNRAIEVEPVATFRVGRDLAEQAVVSGLEYGVVVRRQDASAVDPPGR